MTIDWNELLDEQLDWHWQNQLRPRLEGLTDKEYFWEPVPDCWNVRPRAEGAPGKAFGAGEFVIDFEFRTPRPEPVTTIAWRLAHIIVGVLGQRAASHFGGPPCDYPSFEYAGTASGALRQLDDAYAAWITGVRSLGQEGLERKCGPAEGPYADFPLAALIAHINRETIHHGAEIALLRDLYLRQP